MSEHETQTKSSGAAVKSSIACATRFLTVLAGNAPVTFQTYSDRDDLKVKRPGKKDFDPNAKWRHGTLGGLEPYLKRLNTRGAGIFVMVNEGDGKGRCAANVQRIRALFIDTDGAPYPANLPLQPHLVVQSSPGRWHLYWLVDGVLLDSFSTLQKPLAEHYGTDTSVNDLPRVLRVPGFYHRKGEPVLVELLEVNDAPPYSPEAIFSAWPFLTEKLEQHRTEKAEKERNRAARLAEAKERKQRPNADDDPERKRALAILNGHFDRVANAGDGTRHNTLWTSARALGGYVASSYLDAHEVRELLTDAAKVCGLPEAEAADAILHGLTRGADDPLKLENDLPHITFSSPFDENGCSSNKSPWLSQKADLTNTSRTQIGKGWTKAKSPWGGS
jgi:hypothetical protein